mmetsp:Transcript_33258/g.106098  ORF Transcript_33258/g.106098 Transcript_33258/m.106098 type:complete len:295 (-) Transcript_33258:163-1047(-)
MPAPRQGRLGCRTLLPGLVARQGRRRSHLQVAAARPPLARRVCGGLPRPRSRLVRGGRKLGPWQAGRLVAAHAYCLGECPHRRQAEQAEGGSGEARKEVRVHVEGRAGEGGQHRRRPRQRASDQRTEHEADPPSLPERCERLRPVLLRHELSQLCTQHRLVRVEEPSDEPRRERGRERGCDAEAERARRRRHYSEADDGTPSDEVGGAAPEEPGEDLRQVVDGRDEAGGRADLRLGHAKVADHEGNHRNQEGDDHAVGQAHEEDEQKVRARERHRDDRLLARGRKAHGFPLLSC